MNIIIVGAGQVGSSLAAQWVMDQHNVTVIDLDEERLSELQLQYDLRTVHGYGASPLILEEAGAATADMMIAVTYDDDTNIVACLAAATVFNIPKKIARVRSADYFSSSGLFFAGDRAPVDIFINPAALITHALMHLIEFPGALRVFDFAGERIKLVASKPLTESVLVNKTAAQLQECLPQIAAKILAIYRNNQLMPLADTRIAVDDDILFVAETHDVPRVLGILQPRRVQTGSKRIMIIGGGYIGSQLAQLLEADYQVKLIEQNRQRCELLARQLRNTVVLHGNGCDSSLLRQEDVENIDCFCALSNNDADNIVSALHSKQMGARQAIALVNRDAYLSLILSGYLQVDVALSPQQITTSAILKHLHRGVVSQAYSLRRGAAEGLALTVQPRSKADGSSLIGLSLPEAVQIGAIVRRQAIIIPESDTNLHSEDTVIAFVSDKTQIPLLERLFSAKDEQ